MSRDDAGEIKRRLNERLEQFVDHFWPGHVVRGKIAYCAPSGRKDDLGSFVVYLGQVGKYSRGSWVRSSAGIGGDEINLFAYGLTGQHRANAEVFQRAREFVGLDNSRPETVEERHRREERTAAAEEQRAADERRNREREQRRVRSAGEIWMESTALASTQGEAYLLERGIPVPPAGWGESLRFNPQVLYELDDNLSFPTIVCRVDDAFGELTGIWKIHLDPKKPTKAPVAKAKLGMGLAAGGAVRLGGMSEHVGTGEGVETSLAAAALIKYRYPVWSTLSTSGMQSFEPPLGVARVTAFPDGDKPWRKQDGDLVLAEPAGRAAVRKLRERMTAIDMAFDVQREPRIRQDYLDVWNVRRKLLELA